MGCLGAPTYDTGKMVRRQVEPAPAELRKAAEAGVALEAWFRTHGRSFPWRGWRDEYRVVVTEILLQRTRAETVAAFAPAFFDRYPSWDPLPEPLNPSLNRHLRR